MNVMDGTERAKLLRMLVDDIRDAENEIRSEVPGAAEMLTIQVSMQIALELNATATALQDINDQMQYANNRQDND